MPQIFGLEHSIYVAISITVATLVFTFNKKKQLKNLQKIN